MPQNATTTTRRVAIADPVATVTETVTVRPLSAGRGYLIKSDRDWGWSDLRDFLVTEIEARLRPGVSIVRNPAKEAGILKAYLGRWPAPAGVLIAKRAFAAPFDGWWHGAPIRVERFCAASDPYFAVPLAQAIAEAREMQSSLDGTTGQIRQ